MPSSPDSLTPEQIRELEKKAAEAEKAEREAIERGMAWLAAPREVLTAQEQAEHDAAWWDAALDAAGFFAMENVPPVQAAMLLCRFSPHDETLRDAETSTTDETTPDDFKRLLATFEDRAVARPGVRSLVDWMAVAAGASRKTHSWAARYAKHHGLYGPPAPEASPAPAAPPVPLVMNVNVVNITQPPAPAPEQAPAAPEPATAPPPETTPAPMKTKALIADFEREWPSVAADIREASRNGLKDSAHAGRHGYWHPEKAREWAVSNGKMGREVLPQKQATPWDALMTNSRA